MDPLFSEDYLTRLPWLRYPAIKSRIADVTKLLAAADNKTSQLIADIADLTADPPRLNKSLLKRKAALIKTLNLTDAAIIATQQVTIINLEQAALNTQIQAVKDKRKVTMGKFNSDLAALLTAIDEAVRPGTPEWLVPFPDQPRGAGVPVINPRFIIDAGIKQGIIRHLLTFKATQLRHQDAAATKDAKRAAKKLANDAVLNFTVQSFNTAVQAAVRRTQTRSQPTGQTQARQRKPPNNRRMPQGNAPTQNRRQPRTPRGPSRRPQRPSRPAQLPADRSRSARRQPAPRSRPATPTGNVRGRRRQGSRSGGQIRRYSLRPTAARAARGGGNIV
jgi:hypothetical protein